MKAVILAAGMGIRLRPLTIDVPKGLIPIEEKTLLERSLDALSKHGFQEVIIVLGYHADQIQQKFGSSYGDLQITYAMNQAYETTGSMYSLLCAKEAINGEDICVLESDLLYDDKALQVLLQAEEQDAILITKLQHNGDDVYICTDDQGRINKLGKAISDEDKQRARGALMGISRYSADFQTKLFAAAQHDHDSGERKKHYEECVFATSHEQEHPVYTVLSSELVWTEIDNENDLQRAKEIVLPKLKQLQASS